MLGADQRTREMTVREVRRVVARTSPRMPMSCSREGLSHSVPADPLARFFGIGSASSRCRLILKHLRASHACFLTPAVGRVHGRDMGAVLKQ